MNKKQIQDQLLQTQVTNIELIHRTEAAQKCFQAASFSNDGIESQRQRELLHTLLDQQLDSMASVMSLTKLLIMCPD